MVQRVFSQLTELQYYYHVTTVAIHNTCIDNIDLYIMVIIHTQQYT